MIWSPNVRKKALTFGGHFYNKKTALGVLKGRQLIKENYSMDKIECNNIISQQQKLSDDKSSK